jgi:hypothetical protein
VIQEKSIHWEHRTERCGPRQTDGQAPSEKQIFPHFFLVIAKFIPGWQVMVGPEEASDMVIQVIADEFSMSVAPAKAGVQKSSKKLDSRFRGNDA